MFQFVAVKFSVYLNRHVFVMVKTDFRLFTFKTNLLKYNCFAQLNYNNIYLHAFCKLINYLVLSIASSDHVFALSIFFLHFIIFFYSAFTIGTCVKEDNILVH